MADISTTRELLDQPLDVGVVTITKEVEVKASVCKFASGYKVTVAVEGIRREVEFYGDDIDWISLGWTIASGIKDQIQREVENG